MLSASHIAVGAATGTVCKRAWLAVPVAFMSHFVCDQIPHSCFNMITDRAGLRGIAVGAGLAVDAAIIAAVFVLAWRSQARWVAIAAALAAFAPDPLCHIAPINEWFALLPGSQAVPWVHSTFHCDVTLTKPVLGFITQAAVVLPALYVLTKRKTKPTGEHAADG